jgi:hypothetical protein
VAYHNIHILRSNRLYSSNFLYAQLSKHNAVPRGGALYHRPAE